MLILMFKDDIQILADHFSLGASLSIPEKAKALVIFSHGSGSSRFSPRNNYVANVLNKHQVATILADLLTPQEDMDYDNRFNIPLLSNRLTIVTGWALQQKKLMNLPVGYFGASTGAASALHSAVLLKDKITAIVSRGGRPDLASTILPQVKAATLLIVGSEDIQVIELNQLAYDLLTCKKQMKIVQGATHLFEEPGKLEQVAQMAEEWFEENLFQQQAVKEKTH
jgi:putative phosphoribosyl transferase